MSYDAPMATMKTFVSRSAMPVPVEELFAWHARPGALQRLLPPWDTTQVLEQTGSIEDGDRVVLRVTAPFPRKWVAVHEGYQPGRAFTDVQVEGPFASWKHTHLFLPDGDHGAILEDHVEYSLPGGSLGEALGGKLVEKKLATMFRFRHDRTRHDLARHAPFPGPRLNVAIAGASGLIGSALSAYLATAGHTVMPIGRGKVPGGVQWDPAKGQLNAAALEGADAVINLAGRGVATRWTPGAKRAIRDSRVQSTDLLARAIADMQKKPAVLISASGIGYYGSRGEQLLAENSPPGDDFLAGVCKDWEAATKPAEDAGVRTVHLRIAMVLAGRGGALPMLALPVKYGVGGPVAGGRQWVSWIAIDDLIGLIEFIIGTPAVAGPVNACSPDAVTNRDLVAILGKVLHRPTVAPFPKPAVKLLFGEMGTTTLLGSQKVSAGKAVAAGFEFLYPEAEEAVRAELGRY